MSRDNAAIQAELLSLLPQGFAWSRRPDSGLGRVLLAMAAEFARFEGQAEAMLPEADPRTAVALLPDYERVLGPDPCGRDQLDLSISARQRLVHQRWTMRGGASIGFFKRLAATLGVEIEIEEIRPNYAGEMEAGDELVPEEERYAWIIHLPASRLTEFEAGDAEAGDPLGDLEPNLLECVIRLYAPAHTLPIFSYPEDI